MSEEDRWHVLHRSNIRVPRLLGPRLQYTNQLFSILKSANDAGKIVALDDRLHARAFMYPSEDGANCAIAAVVRSVTRALKGQDGEVFYSPAALDAGYLNQRGTETIMLGPVDLRFAHTDEEVVSTLELHDAARVYAGLALEMLAK